MIITCQKCGEREPAENAWGYAFGRWFCPKCASEEGVACTSCHNDGGNGAGGYSNCCGAPLSPEENSI